MLDILYLAGTFGNFLRLFLDKFSRLTPDLTGDPFTETGTVHKPVKYSNLIRREILETFISNNINSKNLNICLITPDTEYDFLYLKIGNWFRANDLLVEPNHLWSKEIKELKKIDVLKDAVLNIENLYQLDSKTKNLQKFLVRDWYKLEFLSDLKESYNYKHFQKLKNNKFFLDQNVHLFPMGSFFQFELFLQNVKVLSDLFGLDIDFRRKDEMHDLFQKGYDLDIYRQQNNLVKKVITGIEGSENVKITELDVANEAFIYAQIEKKNPGVIAPLTNSFFNDCLEIKNFIRCYPNFYKMKNPHIKR